MRGIADVKVAWGGRWASLSVEIDRDEACILARYFDKINGVFFL